MLMVARLWLRLDKRHSRLLLNRFQRYKALQRTPNRLADRFGVGRVVRVALHVGCHIGGWHEARLMAKRNQFAGRWSALAQASSLPSGSNLTLGTLTTAQKPPGTLHLRGTQACDFHH